MIVDRVLFVMWPNVTKGSFDFSVGGCLSKDPILSRLAVIVLVELKM